MIWARSLSLFQKFYFSDVTNPSDLSATPTDLAFQHLIFILLSHEISTMHRKNWIIKFTFYIILTWSESLCFNQTCKLSSYDAKTERWTHFCLFTSFNMHLETMFMVVIWRLRIYPNYFKSKIELKTLSNFSGSLNAGKASDLIGT